MKKTVILLALSLITVSGAQAYFRSNTDAANKARLADKQARLTKEIASTKSSDAKNKAEIELGTTISEIEWHPLDKIYQ